MIIKVTCPIRAGARVSFDKFVGIVCRLKRPPDGFHHLSNGKRSYISYEVYMGDRTILTVPTCVFIEQATVEELLVSDCVLLRKEGKARVCARERNASALSIIEKPDQILTVWKSFKNPFPDYSRVAIKNNENNPRLLQVYSLMKHRVNKKRGKSTFMSRSDEGPLENVRLSFDHLLYIKHKQR